MARYSKKKSKKSPPQRPSAPQKIDRKRPYAKRKQWTDGQMEAAIKAVLDSSAESINAAARDYGVPATTLKNRLSGRVVHGTNPGPMPYLSTKEEERLVEYLLDANKVGYGKTRRQVKVIVDRVATERVFFEVLESVMGGGVVFCKGILGSLCEAVIQLVMFE